jgi:hypothetical protein
LVFCAIISFGRQRYPTDEGMQGPPCQGGVTGQQPPKILQSPPEFRLAWHLKRISTT